MIEYIKEYPSIFEQSLNKSLMKKEADRPLVEYVLDSWKSLQILEGIKFLDYEYTEMMSDIEINNYIFKRQKGRKKSEKYDFKFIEDNRVGRLTVRLLISTFETDFKTGKTIKKEKIIKKSMLIPLQDENGFYFIKGKKYYMIYQMVEKSTYTSANSVILKSLMPFAIRRHTIDVEDVNKNQYTLPYYTVDLFKKDIPVMLIYCCKGMDSAIQFAISSFPYMTLDFTTEYDEDDTKNIYFGISTKLFLKVRKDIFEEFTYIQSVVGGLINICTNRLTIDKLDDSTLWIKKLSQSNLEKGKNLLMSLQRLMDVTTKKILKIDIYNKIDVLNTIRWMTQEFNNLRMKDNMDLSNKRLRCNEYIASLLTQEFSKKLNRIMSLGSKANLDNYREIFRFAPDILIQRMHASGIFRYDETINDMDMFSNFKYTNKGPHSAGQKNKNSVGITYRGLHPSMIGYIDMTVCGASDPGTSGTLSPYSDIKGLYFDDSDEPDDFKFDFIKDMSNILKKENVSSITIDFDNKEDYYRTVNELRELSDKNINVYATSKVNSYDIILEDEEDLEEAKNQDQKDIKSEEK
jgi:hypothetical protein